MLLWRKYEHLKASNHCQHPVGCFYMCNSSKLTETSCLHGSIVTPGATGNQKHMQQVEERSAPRHQRQAGSGRNPEVLTISSVNEKNQQLRTWTSDCCERHWCACLLWAQTAALFYLTECQIHQKIKIMRCTKWWTDLYLMKKNVSALIPIHSATFTAVLGETAD